MAAHTTEQRAFIVRQLAAWESPFKIILEFARLWKDTACELSDVAACEPERLTPDWKAYFDQERERFLSAPTADKRVRIAFLHRFVIEALSRGAHKPAAEFLEQIAKEDGGFYAGKATAAAPIDVASLPTRITRTIVYPTPRPVPAC